MIDTWVRRSICSSAVLFAATAFEASAQNRAVEPRLDLRTVLDSVARSHPAIEAARQRANAAHGARTSAGGFGNPMLSYQVENTAFPGRTTPVGIDREVTTTLTLPLEPIYQRGARVRQADAEVRAADAEADASRQLTLRDAAHAYFLVAQVQVRVEAMREVASWLDTVVSYNRSRVEEGVVAEADLIRAEVERGRVSAELVARESDLVRARAELAAFLGDSNFVRSSNLVTIPRDVLSMPDVARAVTGARPDVRMARARMEASEAAVGAERTMLIRDLGVTLGSKRMLGTTSMVAGLSVPVPLFNQNRGEIARASAERSAATLDLEVATRSAQMQLVGLREAARLLTTRASALASAADTGYLARAEQAKQIALGAYREGAVPLLQVLDAARAWSDARIAFYDLLLAQHQSVLDLLVASGADLRTSFASYSSATP
jgi:cobalt-zinc-cadmium efflux system outer membrane protein